MSYFIKIKRDSIRRNPETVKLMMPIGSSKTKPKITTRKWPTDLLIKEGQFKPSLLYEYEDCMVICDKCNVEFDHALLEESNASNKGLDASSKSFFSKCPFCGENKCCNIEYESIKNVIRELKT